jgi:hypothetical protein
MAGRASEEDDFLLGGRLLGQDLAVTREKAQPTGAEQTKSNNPERVLAFRHGRTSHYQVLSVSSRFL